MFTDGMAFKNGNTSLVVQKIVKYVKINNTMPRIFVASVENRAFKNISKWFEYCSLNKCTYSNNERPSSKLVKLNTTPI